MTDTEVVRESFITTENICDVGGIMACPLFVAYFGKKRFFVMQKAQAVVSALAMPVNGYFG